MGCVAGSALALAAPSPLVYVGVPALLGLVNWKMAKARRRGLLRSLSEIDRRHKAFLAFIEGHECLRIVGFSRVRRSQRGDGTVGIHDPVHDKKMSDFRAIFTLINITSMTSIVLLVFGILKLLIRFHNENFWKVLGQ